VLSADITKQIGEYATLKAMGYQNGFLSRVVLEQAVVLGVISYIVAFAISLVLYKIVGDAANLPIAMTVGRQFIVFGSTILMCCVSGSIAMQKLRRADPADLF
jgi:putative ABC transport system permease protein